MKALRLIKAKKFQVVDMQIPSANGRDVIIRMDMVGLCGSDLTLWKGTKIFGTGHIIGHEYCGTVIDPGSRKDLLAGDRVVGMPTNFCRDCFFCRRGMENLCNDTVTKGGPGVTTDGACVEKFGIVADKAFKVDRSLDPRLAALAEPVANGHHAAITRGNVQKGEKVLIIGGGIIAILTAWWARQAGAYVVISEINQARREHLMRYRVADDVVNPLEEDAVGRLIEKNGIGFDKVFECSHPSSKLFDETLIPLTRKGGTIIQVGSMEGTLSFNFFAFQYKELSYLSSWSITEWDFTEAIRAITAFPDAFMPHITNVIAMEDVQSKEMISGKTGDIKVMIDPQR